MMPLGPGKYDDACSAARDKTGGSVLLIVVRGAKGSGFSCQADLETLLSLPDILEGIARELRAGRDR